MRCFNVTCKIKLLFFSVESGGSEENNTTAVSLFLVGDAVALERHLVAVNVAFIEH